MEQQEQRLGKELERVEQKIEVQQNRIEAARRAKEPPELIADVKEEKERLVKKKGEVRQQLSTLQAQLAGQVGAVLCCDQIMLPCYLVYQAE